MSKPAKQKTDMNAVTVFFDIDGVLGDFDGHAKAHGKVLPDGRKAYDSMDENWWASMPVFAGAYELFQTAKSMAQVRFLTGPVPNPSSYSGKAKWVQSFFGAAVNRFQSLPHLIICPAGDKAFLAGPKRILVDDSADNVANWRVAGGLAIHHTGDFAKTAALLREALQSLTAVPSPSGPELAP